MNSLNLDIKIHLYILIFFFRSILTEKLNAKARRRNERHSKMELENQRGVTLPRKNQSISTPSLGLVPNTADNYSNGTPISISVNRSMSNISMNKTKKKKKNQESKKKLTTNDIGLPFNFMYVYFFFYIYF